MSATISRKQIGIRFLYTVLFIFIFELVQAVIYLTAFVQYVFLFITKTPSQRLRSFGNQAAAYGYRVMRFLTVNDNAAPFPFQEFPEVVEPPEEEVKFD
jgi:hypothetical protein